MRSSKPSARSFNVRSDRGFITPPAPRFTTGFVAESSGVRQEVSDDDVIREALRILSQRVRLYPVLSNPRVVREYLALRAEGLDGKLGCRLRGPAEPSLVDRLQVAQLLTENFDFTRCFDAQADLTALDLQNDDFDFIADE